MSKRYYKCETKTYNMYECPLCENYDPAFGCTKETERNNNNKI